MRLHRDEDFTHFALGPPGPLKVHCWQQSFFLVTLPETNVADENPTILMVFTRKDGNFMGYVRFREGTYYSLADSCFFLLMTQVLFLVFHLWTNGPVFPYLHFTALSWLLRSWVLHTRVLPILTPPRLWRHTIVFFSLSWTNSEGYFFHIYLFSTASNDRNDLHCRHWHHNGYMPHLFYAFFLFSFLKLLFPFGFYIPGTLSSLERSCWQPTKKKPRLGAWPRGEIVDVLSFKPWWH